MILTTLLLLQGAPEIFGRFQSDWTFVSAGTATEAALGESLEGGTEVRRVRLGAKGEFAEGLKYKAEFEFAGGSAALADVYGQWTDGPLGQWKLGHFKEPFGLEELTSSRFITFLERSLVADAFAPSRNAGLMVSDASDSVTWAAGVFRKTDKTGKSTDQAWSATGRVVWRPWYEDDGASLLHFGAAVSFRNPDGDASFAVRPENHFLPDFVDGSTMVDDYVLLGLEAALQEGPFHASVEVVQADLNATAGGSPSTTGASAQAGWFVTGEHRGYKTSSGAWSRVHPKSNAFEGGVGAWELAARASTLDLGDLGQPDLDTVGVALNGYLTSHVRVMFDVLQADLQGADSTTIVAFRFAFDF